ncbi:MAG TPA: hypothetical protein VF605_04045 [Allosphingosinicella sp.]|jgi:hypothetical protein
MRTALALLALAALGACGGPARNGNEAGGNHVSEDPYGATGAPGADLTDNGANDGSNGLADGNSAR